MDDNKIKQDLQNALDREELAEHPDEILRHEDETVATPLFEKGENNEEEEYRYDGDS